MTALLKRMIEGALLKLKSLENLFFQLQSLGQIERGHVVSRIDDEKGRDREELLGSFDAVSTAFSDVEFFIVLHWNPRIKDKRGA